MTGVTPLFPDLPWGMFWGECVTQWVDDGEERLMRLLAALHYIRADGHRYTAREGLVFDGASIPRLAWSLIGSPFTGRYRRAAVIHDQLCKDRTLPAPLAHRVFYEAMRCEGLPARTARVMQLAVLARNPYWRVQPLRSLSIAIAQSHARARARA